MSESPNRLRCFYRCDDAGAILEVVHTHVLRGAGWHEATSQEDVDRLMHEAGRWRRGDDGALAPLPHVRLRVNGTVFKADGEDAAVWIVAALDAVPEGATVRVRVNGEAQEWRFGELHEVRTLAPGTWTVSLDDRRYYAENRTATATAHPPERFAS